MTRKTARSIMSAGGTAITTFTGIVAFIIFAFFAGAYLDVAGSSEAIISALQWMHDAPPIWGLGLMAVIFSIFIMTCGLELIAKR